MVLSQLAAEIGVEYRTLHNWVRKYSIPHEKVGKQKLVVVTPEGVRVLRALAANPPFALKSRAALPAEPPAELSTDQKRS